MGGASESGSSDWGSVATLDPDAFAALSGLVAAAWDDTDPVLLELSRLRIATLLRHTEELDHRSPIAREAGLTEAKVTELSAWPTSTLFTAPERACLSFVEQFVMDANGVTDDQVAEVVSHVGAAGCYAFVQAVSVLETFQRACLTLGIHSVPSVGTEAATRVESKPEDPL
jgi:alkylhydroperoxidase family enzyme